ncbi:MAG: hypothetical protein JW787_03885, partial [Sedimentisphaerales bacterium]|nr:hypothetical protein [Sedimentisphaerales bacterium]
MAAKYRNIRNLIAIWLIVSIVISTVAKTETLIEKEISLSQTRSLPGQGVLASLDNIESPYQILQRARIGQKTGEQPEPKYKTEPNAELEYRDEPSPNNEYRPVSDSDFVAVAKLKTVRIQSMLTLPMSYLVIPRIDTTPVEPLEILKIPDDAPKEPAFFVIKAGDRNVTGLTYRSMKNMNQVKLVLDTDGDGIFSDEKEYLGARDPMIITFMTYNFGNVTTQNIKEGISGGIFNVQCTNGEWLTLHPVLYREGKVVLDGTSYRIG